ncbi:FAD-dependent oxidoreductase [Halomontanus rarus]|uniref:FAD-dependent oxidoreductase n=1 Tax=Halomontanus rarus TaxID=3034020 RepID=UPI0023E75EA3|nr:FAD-dependent oxidoreductase [Halovivax sp. TS33]
MVSPAGSTLFDVKTVTADLTVVGGGIAGTCAAVAAARQGLETVLVNDRPVLGGNSSSEVRVWVNGATGGNHNRYARESGIIEEIILENKARNPDGNADRWDLILEDLVSRESTLDVYRNTLVDEVQTDGERITRVAGSQNMSETQFRFESPLFIDATGDGVLAAQIGAEWVQGREAAAEFGERAAPEVADAKTLGSSIMFYTVERDGPVPFDPPDLAHDFRDDPPEVLAQRVDPDDRRCCYWWIEYGGAADLDPIGDNETIRDELWAIALGAFDYLKNSGDFPENEVANLALEWIGKIPGKRESRRFRGAYVLTEDDLVEQRRFDDAVGHGGWSIDLHPPSGFYDDQGRGSEHWHLDGPYAVPYRSLYVPGVDNLWLAGRHISASHVAFGSVRVQMTLGTLGQAVGTAAAVAADRDATPQGVYEEYVPALQQILLREDQWLLDVPNRDPEDLARDATVTASSERVPGVESADTSTVLREDLGVYLPVAESANSVQFKLDTDAPTELGVAVHAVDRPENYVPADSLGSETISVPDGPSWVEVPIDGDPGVGQGIFLVFESNPDVRVLGHKTRLPSLLAGWRTDSRAPELVEDVREVEWPPLDWVPCVRGDLDPEAFAAANVTDGFARPFGLPHCWRTERLKTDRRDDATAFLEEPHLELAWKRERLIGAIQLAFDTRLTTNFNPLTPTDEPRVAECIRTYRVEALIDGEWKRLHRETGNYQRFRRHVFEPIETDSVRIVVEETNGTPYAEIFEVRAYAPDVDWPLTNR